MRILVVEDERKVANFISQGLQEEGHTVEVAKDGEAALDLLENGPPYDLIVLDVMLPRLGGFAVLRAARAARVRSPVLMLTARDAVADKVAGLDAGADDYLTKPFSFDEFLARVRALLRRADERPGPPAPGERRGRACPEIGRPHARPRHARGGAPRPAHRAHRPRARAPRIFPAQSRTRPHASAARRARVGAGLRPREQRRGRLCRLPAPQDRRPRRRAAAPHGPRRRVRPAAGRRLTCGVPCPSTPG